MADGPPTRPALRSRATFVVVPPARPVRRGTLFRAGATESEDKQTPIAPPTLRKSKTALGPLLVSNPAVGLRVGRSGRVSKRAQLARTRAKVRPSNVSMEEEVEGESEEEIISAPTSSRKNAKAAINDPPPERTTVLAKRKRQNKLLYHIHQTDGTQTWVPEDEMEPFSEALESFLESSKRRPPRKAKTPSKQPAKTTRRQKGAGEDEEDDAAEDDEAETPARTTRPKRAVAKKPPAKSKRTREASDSEADVEDANGGGEQSANDDDREELQSTTTKGKRSTAKSTATKSTRKKRKVSDENVDDAAAISDADADAAPPVPKARGKRKAKAAAMDEGETPEAVPKKRLTKKAKAALELAAKAARMTARAPFSDSLDISSYSDVNLVSEPDTSCCALCSSREWGRAVISGDFAFLEKCTKCKKSMAMWNWGSRPEVPNDTALYHALIQDDVRAVTVLMENYNAMETAHYSFYPNDNDQLRERFIEPPEESYVSPSKGSGYVSANTFNHRVRAVNESRGNREGDTAFYKFDPKTKLKEKFDLKGAIMASNATGEMAPITRRGGRGSAGRNKVVEGFDAIEFALLYALRGKAGDGSASQEKGIGEDTLNFLLTKYTDKVRGFFGKSGIYEACAAGNRTVAAHLVDALSNGFGFNHLHLEALKLENKDSFSSYTANQLQKKAIGNYSISPVQMAAINPNKRFLKELCDQLNPSQLAEADELGRTVAHFAVACKGSTEGLEYLMSKGVDFNVADAAKFTPLMLCARYGRAENLRVLLPAIGGKEANAADRTLLKQGYRPLHLAAFYGHAEACEVLIEFGATVNAIDKDTKCTPLHDAARRGHLEAVKVLVEAGATLDMQDKMGRSALILASKNGHVAVVVYLLQQGADTEVADTSNNVSLHYAAAYGWVGAAKALIEFGKADPNAANNWKTRPLGIAYKKGHLKMFDYLLHIDTVDVSYRDEDGKTILHYMVAENVKTEYEMKRLLQKAQLLLSRMGNPFGYKTVSTGDTFLHSLARTSRSTEQPEHHTKLLELLIEHGANIEETNKAGETAIQCAFRAGNNEIILGLIRSGANLTPATLDDRSAPMARGQLRSGNVRNLGESDDSNTSSGDDDVGSDYSDENENENTSEENHHEISSLNLVSYVLDSAAAIDKDMVEVDGPHRRNEAAAATAKIESRRKQLEEIWSAVLARIESDDILSELCSMRTGGRTVLIRAVEVALQYQESAVNELASNVQNFYVYGHNTSFSHSVEIDTKYDCWIRMTRDLLAHAKPNLDTVILTPPSLSVDDTGKPKEAVPVSDHGLGIIHLLCRAVEPNLLKFFLENGLNPKTPTSPFVTSSQKEKKTKVEQPTVPLVIAMNAVSKLRSISQAEKIIDKVQYKSTHLDANSRHRDCIKLLLDAGADGSYQVGDQETPLMLAIRTKLEMAGIEASRRANQNGVNGSVREYTDAQAWLQIIKRIIENGSNLSARTKEGKTALGRAIEAMSPELVKLLVKKGADVEGADDDGVTHAMLAASTGSMEILKAVVGSAAKPPLSLATKLSDETALFYACKTKGRFKSIKFMLEDGNEPAVNHARSSDGKTVLVLAIEYSDIELVRLLLSYGANAEVTFGKSRTTLLMVAAASGKLNVLELLLDAGADLNSSDMYGASPLHHAVTSRSVQIVSKLLQSGANVNTCDNYGATPLHHAVHLSKSDKNVTLRIERLLLDHGASIKATDNHKRNILHVACVKLGQIPKMKNTESVRKSFTAAETLRKRRQQAEETFEGKKREFANWTFDGALTDWMLQHLVSKPEVVYVDGMPVTSEIKKELELVVDDIVNDPKYTTKEWEATSAGAKHDPIEIVQFLLNVPGMIEVLNSADAFGRTPLHYAAAVGAFTCSSVLLSKGADHSIRDMDNNRPLSLAVLNSNVELAVMMATKGADILDEVTLSDEKMISTFQYALKYNMMGIAVMILENRLDVFKAFADTLGGGKFHLAVLLLNQGDREKLRGVNHEGQNLSHIFGEFEITDMSSFETFFMEIAEILDSNNIDYTAEDKSGKHAIHYAAKYKNKHYLSWLLEKSAVKANLNVMDKSGYTPLQYALENGMEVAIKELVTRGANPGIANPEVCASPVLLATKLRNPLILELILKGGAQPDLDVPHGRPSALMVALQDNDGLEAVQKLVSSGANVNLASKRHEKDSNVFPPVFLAIEKSTVSKDRSGRVKNSKLSILLQAGADPNVVHPESLKYPLGYALNDHFKAEMLLRAGADVDSIDPKTERTAFQHAFFSNENIRLLELLMSYNPNISLADNITGLTPLDYAIRNNDKKRLALLLAANVDVNVRSNDTANPDQLTSLMLCAVLNNSDMLKDILDSKSKSIKHGFKDKKGKNIVHRIVAPFQSGSFENFRMLQILMAATRISPAVLNARDLDGNRPIDLASKQVSTKLYDLLIIYGADASVDPNRPTPMDLEDGSLDAFPDSVDVKADSNLCRAALSEKAAADSAKAKKKAKVDFVLNFSSEVADVVLDETGSPFDAYMTKTDVDKGLSGQNMFYKMQVVHHKIPDVYILATRWGGIGETGMHQKTPFATMEECVAEYKKLFKSKTGVLWEERHHSDVAGKFVLYRAVERVNITVKPFSEITTTGFDESKLIPRPKDVTDSAIQLLIRQIADVANLRSDVQKANLGLPIGNLENHVLEQGMRLLKKIKDAIQAMQQLEESNRSAPKPDIASLKKIKLKLVDLSNKFFRKVPSSSAEGAKTILDMGSLNKFMGNVNNMMYIDHAANILLGAFYRSNELHPYDYVLRSLQCSVKTLARSDEEFDLIAKYMGNSSSRYMLEYVYRVERAGEFERYEAGGYLDMENKMLLWHGSSMSNMMGILSQGLRVAPIGATSSGYSFGKGIYFADVFEKSVGYCSSTKEGFRAILLCEVACGKQYETPTAEYMESPKEGFDSTTGIGRNIPDPRMTLRRFDDGVALHLGNLTERSSASGTQQRVYLNYNEFIVYDPAQVQIRYVCLVRDSHQCLLCGGSDSSTVKEITKHVENLRREWEKRKVAASSTVWEDDGGIPSKVLSGMKFERTVVARLMDSCSTDWFSEFEGKELSLSLWQEQWKNVTSLSISSRICERCLYKMIEGSLVAFMRFNHEKLPERLRTRQHCKEGIDCRDTKLEHQQQFNHVCFKTDED